jgi:hypothetical protein
MITVKTDLCPSRRRVPPVDGLGAVNRGDGILSKV